MAHRRAPSWLSLLAVAVLSLSMIQVFVAIMPELYWDVSPLTEPEAVPAVALGPTGVAWLSVLSILVLSFTLLVNRSNNAPLQWPALVLGGIGLITAGWHLFTGDGTDAFRCNAWIGAIALGLAACHLVQHEAPRRILSAGLMALMVPLLLGAFYAVYVDHPITVRFFLEREAQTVAQRGWEWNSPQHLIYKRRLTQAEATGSFGFANTFGSMMTALTLLTAGVALAHLRESPRKRAMVTILLTLAGAATLLLSGARGAILTLLLVGGLLLLISWRTIRTRWLVVLSMLLVLLPIGVVMMRLLSGPPAGVEGERSLLFRGFYWQGAANLVMHEPITQTLTGIGPSRFKDLHARYKHPLNPEDVASTHNLFIDWGVMLGVGGLAWSILLLYWLVRACRSTITENGHAAWQQNHDQVPLSHIDPRWLGWIALAAIPAGLTQYLVQASTMYLERSLLWLLALGAFIFIATLLAQSNWFTDRGLRWGAFAAALALLVHNQIEMTFFHPGSVTIALVLLGLAGSSVSTPTQNIKDDVARTNTPAHSSRGGDEKSTLPPGEGKGEGAAVIGYSTAQNSLAPRPSPGLAHGGDSATLSQGERGNATASSNINPASPRYAKLSSTMLILVMSLLMVLLVTEAIRTTRIQHHLANAADHARQLALPSATHHLQAALQLRPDPHVARSLAEITIAGATNPQAWQQRATELQLMLEGQQPVLRDRLILLRMQAQLADHLYTLTNAPPSAQQAVDHWRRLQSLEPYNPHTALALAQALEKAGQTAASHEMYRHALVLSDRAYLDPLTQLNPAQRRHIEQLLDRSGRQ